MTCVHLRKLYELCQTHELKLGGADLIHIVCHECGEKDVCPSGLMEELPDEQDGETPQEEMSEEQDG